MSVTQPFKSLEKKRYAALALAQSWHASGRLAPIAPPIRSTSLRKRCPRRGSAKVHPASSLSHHCGCSGYGHLPSGSSVPDKESRPLRVAQWAGATVQSDPVGNRKPVSRRISTWNTGVRKRPKAVNPIMPENTANPIACRISASAPMYVTNGTTPTVNAILSVRSDEYRDLAKMQGRPRRGRTTNISCAAGV